MRRRSRPPLADARALRVSQVTLLVLVAGLTFTAVPGARGEETPVANESARTFLPVGELFWFVDRAAADNEGLSRGAGSHAL